METRRAGKSCWSCACKAGGTLEGKVRSYWAGIGCEKQDVSSEFMLLVGSALGLIMVLVLSVSLLYSVGSVELPSTLTSGSAPIPK